MRVVNRAASVAIAALLCWSNVAAAQSAATYPLTERGYGPVTMGMTQPEVEAALGIKLNPDEGDFERCHDTGAVNPADLPDLAFMFEDGRLTRISMFRDEENPPSEHPVLTEQGIGIGATERDVRAVYGPSLAVETAEYDMEPAHSITHWVVPDKSGIRFITTQLGVVYVIHAGTSAINYIEGCA